MVRLFNKSRRQSSGAAGVAKFSESGQLTASEASPTISASLMMLAAWPHMLVRR